MDETKGTWGGVKGGGSRLLIAVALTVLVTSGCGEPSSVDSSQSDSKAAATTTSPLRLTTTSQAVATTSSTTSIIPPVSTTTEVPPTTATEPPVTVALPENPIGSVDPQTVAFDVFLHDLTGVSSYRLRTTLEYAATAGTPGGMAIIESSILEGTSEDENAIHMEMYGVDPEGEISLGSESILINGRSYRRDLDGDWFDSEGLPLFWMVSPPIAYSQMHGVSWHLPSAEWVGNEYMDGVAVGRYEWSDSDQRLGSPPSGSNISATGSFWIDAAGVVWRSRVLISEDGQLFLTQDTMLYDVGVTVTIEVPTIP